MDWYFLCVSLSRMSRGISQVFWQITFNDATYSLTVDTCSALRDAYQKFDYEHNHVEKWDFFFSKFDLMWSCLRTVQCWTIQFRLYEKNCRASEVLFFNHQLFLLNLAGSINSTVECSESEQNVNFNIVHFSLSIFNQCSIMCMDMCGERGNSSASIVYDFSHIQFQTIGFLSQQS